MDGAQDESQDGYVGKKDDKGASSVRSRIKALEASTMKSQGTRLPEPAVPKDATSRVEKSQVPIVYPLHYNRFVRRTSSATPLRPETPIYKSPIPSEAREIYAPRPTRSIPSIKTPDETHMVSKSSMNAGTPTPRKHDAFTSFSRAVQKDTQRITPASYLHGTRDSCVRHGRKRQHGPLMKQPTGTRDMLAKSRSGAYIPTGLNTRRQMEATSPWVVPSKSLTRTVPSSSSQGSGSDPCPDCLTELNIKRREWYGSTDTVKTPTHHHAPPTTSSMATQPSASTNQHSLHSRGMSNLSSEDEDKDLVTSKDLGDRFDAIIMEHRGELRRVVLNARHGKATMETMQRLSRELANVSNSIAFVGVGDSHGFVNRNQGLRESAILVEAKSMRGRDVRTSSVSDLLDMIDQAASDIHLNTGRLAERYVSRRDFAGEDRQSLFEHEDVGNVFQGHASPKQGGLVDRQNINEQYRDVHEHLVNGLSRTTVPAAQATKPAAPLPSKAEQKAKAPGASQIPMPSNPATPIKPSPNVPTIIKTKLTLPQAKSSATDTSPLETPPPEHPSLHHAAELSNLPVSAKPTPDFEKAKQSQGYHLPGFWDLFHSAQTPKAASAPHEQKPSPFNTASKRPQSLAAPSAPPILKPHIPLSPLQTPALPSGPNNITSHANPYHHAPTAPLDYNKAAWSDPKAHEMREHRQAIRAAMRIEKNKAVQEAAAVEREVRRKKSLGMGVVRKGLPEENN